MWVEGLPLIGTCPQEADQCLPGHGKVLLPGELVSFLSSPALLSLCWDHAEVWRAREFLGEKLKGLRDLQGGGKTQTCRLTAFFVRLWLMMLTSLRRTREGRPETWGKRVRSKQSKAERRWAGSRGPGGGGHICRDKWEWTGSKGSVDRSSPALVGCKGMGMG